MSDCRICGWAGMAAYHRGAIDCINAYRAYVDELQRLLPKGDQVLLTTIARDVTARLWIDGEVTDAALDRLLIFIGFMKEAWQQDVTPIVNADAEDGTAPARQGSRVETSNSGRRYVDIKEIIKQELDLNTDAANSGG